MDKLRGTFVALRHKAGSLSPLVLLVLVSFLLALLLGGGNDLVGASSLFQSPLPPPEEPTATPSPPPPIPEPTATPMPTETPVPPSEPTATPPPPEATAAAPVETPEAPSEGSPSEPAETPPPAEAPEALEAAEPTPETPEEPEGEGEAPRPEESSPLIFNWGIFLNTVIVTLSYAWICCGVCGLVGTPLIFILLYVGGKRRLRRRLEESEETGQTPGADYT